MDEGDVTDPVVRVGVHERVGGDAPDLFLARMDSVAGGGGDVDRCSEGTTVDEGFRLGFVGDLGPFKVGASMNGLMASFGGVQGTESDRLAVRWPGVPIRSLTHRREPSRTPASRRGRSRWSPWPMRRLLDLRTR